MQHTHFTKEEYEGLCILTWSMDFDSYETADELRDTLAQVQKEGDIGDALADEICFQEEPPDPIFSSMRHADKKMEADLIEKLIGLYKTPKQIIPGLRDTTRECGECKEAYDEYLVFCVESSAMGDQALTDEFLGKLRSLGSEEYVDGLEKQRDEKNGVYDFRDYDFLGVYEKEK